VFHKFKGPVPEWLGETCNLLEIVADEREIRLLQVNTFYACHFFHRFIIVDIAPKCINSIGRIDD
jgi:hypothetical protein